MSLWRLACLAVAAHAQCVTVEVLQPGDGVTFPAPGDTVSIHYTGTLKSNGQKFDSSRDRGKEFSTQIGVGNVIQGWDQGVPQLSLGERAILHISAACGYGARGSPPAIPANADLNFDVQLLGINGQRATGAGAATTPAAPAAPAAPASLPTCRANSCGMAMALGADSLTPVCACDPICLQPGSSLPCCQGFSTVCQSQASQAPPAPARTSAPTQAQSLAPGFVANNFDGRASLPECVTSACGHAISWDPNGLGKPVCLCNHLCATMKDTPGILPCCPKLQEVCLDPYRSPSPMPPPAPKPVVAAAPRATAPVAQTVQAPVQTPTLIQPIQSSAPVQSAPIQSPPIQSAPAPTPKPKGKAASSVASAECTVGATNWAEQADCDKKQWALKGRKCQKVCPALDASLGVKYWNKGAGKDLCAAAQKACWP